MENKNTQRSSIWRAKNPERARELKAQYYARLRGEDVPYTAMQRTSLEEQREKRRQGRLRYVENLKKRLAEDEEFAREWKARRQARQRVEYRRKRGLPDDAALTIGKQKDSVEEREAKLARRRQLRLMTAAEKAEERDRKKAEKKAAHAAEMAARAAERAAKRALDREARKEERRIKRRDAERARRAAKVEEAKARAAENPGAVNRVIKPSNLPKMGRFTALRRWHGY